MVHSRENSREDHTFKGKKRILEREKKGERRKGGGKVILKGVMGKEPSALRDRLDK